MRYFLALSRTLNFTRAAEEVNITQPTLTSAIKKLEDELGGPLIHRERNRTHLTQLGKMLLPFLKQVNESSQAVQSLAGDLTRGDRVPLSLGVSDVLDKTTLIGPIREVRMNIPGLELNVVGGTDTDLFEALVSGDLDLAILEEGAVDPKAAKFDPIYSEVMSILASCASNINAFDTLKQCHIIDQHFIGVSSSCIHDKFASAARLSDPHWMLQHRAARPMEAQIMALSSIGLCLAGSHEPILPGLVRRSLADLKLSRTIGISAARGRRANNAAQLVTRLLQSQAYESSADPVSPGA